MIDPEVAAAALIEARLGYTVLDTFPGGTFPADIGEAYAVLDSIAAQMGVPIGGWKAALTNDAIMQKMGTDSPACGPLFQPYIMAAPKLLNMPDESMRGLECEFAFRMGGNLPSRQDPYSADEVFAAVASLHPAIEVVDSRVKEGMAHGAVAIIADHCANAALVYGHGKADWRDLDLAAHTVRLTVDGEEAVTGVGSEVLGDPRNSLVWVANFLSARGKSLKAGEWVTTGSTMGIYPVPAGSAAIADFGSLGQVEVSFTA
ncbi:MAG: hydratase [Alphaproteobacteria bacterium]|nr:hydratase [Alphaproteobacteria bacterium]